MKVHESNMATKCNSNCHSENNRMFKSNAPSSLATLDVLAGTCIRRQCNV